RLGRGGRRLGSRRDERDPREDARARERRPRALRPAGLRRRRRRPLGRGRRAAPAASRLAGRRADGRRRHASREAPDGVRLRRDRGAAAGRRRRERRDQRAALPVAQGHHGREEEAVRHALARRRRCRRCAGGRGRLEDGGARARRSALARRGAEDRGQRRQLRAGDRRVPRGEKAPVSTLVFLEHHGSELQKGALGVLGKAASLGDDSVAAVLVGGGVKALAAQAGTYGATRVFVVESDELEPPTPQPRVDVLAQLVQEHGFENVLFANSVLAADVAAGLAARLDAGLNWDLTDLTSDFVGKRPALQDSILVDVGWKTTPRLALFRAGSFDAASTGGGEPQVEDVAVEFADYSRAAKVVSQEQEQASGPSIEDADVIVAGGRGLGAPENFTLAEELARALGGAVGATR